MKSVGMNLERCASDRRIELSATYTVSSNSPEMNAQTQVPGWDTDVVSDPGAAESYKAVWVTSLPSPTPIPIRGYVINLVECD